MKKDILKLIIIIFTVTVISALIVRYIVEKKGFYDETPEIRESEEAGVSVEISGDDIEEINKEAHIPLPGSGYDKEAAAKALRAYDSVQAEKICTVITDDGKGNQDMDYTRYYVSDVNLKKLSDKTSDYSKAVGADAFDDEKVESIRFCDAFGFSYESCLDLTEFFEGARKGSGFDADLNEASYDEEKYSMNKEESYEFKGDCSILYTMLGDMDYDTLLKSVCYYTLSRGEDGSKYPVMFTAVVQYKKDGKTITKTAYLGFNYYNDGEEIGCSCGNDDPSDLDESTPCPSCGGTDGCKEGCSGDCCR